VSDTESSYRAQVCLFLAARAFNRASLAFQMLTTVETFLFRFLYVNGIGTLATWAHVIVAVALTRTLQYVAGMEVGSTIRRMINRL
jgi:hypothetical protein